MRGPTMAKATASQEIDFLARTAHPSNNRIPPVNGLHDQLRVLGPPSGAFLRGIPSLVNGKNLTGVISQIRVSDQCTSCRLNWPISAHFEWGVTDTRSRPFRTILHNAGGLCKRFLTTTSE